MLNKARFWERFAKEPLNERQIKVLNRLLEGFEGKLIVGNSAQHIASALSAKRIADRTGFSVDGARRRTWIRCRRLPQREQRWEYCLCIPEWSQRPVVGVLQQLPGEMFFSLSDAATKTAQWSAKLSQSVAPDSLIIASDGSVFYVDTEVAAIFRASGAGTRLVWKLGAEGSNVDAHATRIVSVTPGRSSTPAIR